MELNNCTNCGGKVEFSPTDRALKCVKCGTIYPIICTQKSTKKFIKESDKDEGFKEWGKGIRSCRCTNCGATIVLHDLEMTNKCQYCNTYSLVPLDSLPGLKPDIVLPFKISKEQARQLFKEKLQKKRLLPKDFKKNLPHAEIGATYVSAFDFSMRTFSTYSGTKRVERTGYAYGRRESYFENVPFNSFYDHEFNNLVVEASDKISQEQINSILPYNFGESYDYSDDFLKGFAVGYYNKTPLQALEQAKNIAEINIRNILEEKHPDVTLTSVSTRFSFEKYSYALLPVYFINYQYKNKTYMNVMNGQNGQVGGKMPRSKGKIALIAIIITLLVLCVPLAIILTMLFV